MDLVILGRLVRCVRQSSETCEFVPETCELKYFAVYSLLDLRVGD